MFLLLSLILLITNGVTCELHNFQAPHMSMFVKRLRNLIKIQFKGFVDLRLNPGGLLDSVINIVDLFQNEGVIVSVKGRRLNEESIHRSSKFNTMVDEKTPIVVLIDGGSASASEIFSGAIKDNNRGILVGEKSFGKGSVQSIQLLGDGTDGFKLTTAKYYTPSGVSIHGIGIQPDLRQRTELSDEKETSQDL